jgi:hypothetical protein
LVYCTKKNLATIRGTVFWKRSTPARQVTALWRRLRHRVSSGIQGCQILIGTTYQNVKMYQISITYFSKRDIKYTKMAIKYTKWL